LATSATAAVPGLAGADARSLRVGVDDAWHRLVVGLAGLAEDVGGDDPALVLADVGERPDPGDVAYRPQALAGPQVGVDRDAVGVGLDAHRLQAEPVHAGAPSGGDQEPVAPQLAAVVERQHVVLAIAPGLRRAHAQHELDALAAQGLAEGLSQPCRLASQQMLGRVGDGRLAPEAAHDLRHLDAHGPAAQHHQAPGDRLHPRGFPAGPHAVELAQPRDRRHDRIGPGRQDDVVGRVAHPVDLDHARPGEPAGAPEQRDALARQPALLAFVGVVRNHEVPPGERGLDVDPRGGRRVPRRLHRLARAQQRLGRDAGVVRALATHQLALYDGDPQSPVRQGPGTVLARRPPAEDDDVVVTAQDDASPIRPRRLLCIRPTRRPTSLQRPGGGHSAKDTSGASGPSPRRCSA
jgi:hypothetical protein